MMPLTDKLCHMKLTFSNDYSRTERLLHDLFLLFKSFHFGTWKIDVALVRENERISDPF
jgi:hypothetical protein